VIRIVPHRLLFAGCLAMVLNAATFGQAPSPPARQAGGPSAASAAPSVEEIVNRYVRAVGGKAAWQKLTSRVSMGTIEVASANLSGTVVIHEKAPSKILTIIIISGSAFRQGFDGSVGWAEDPQNGVREQSGAELAEAKRQSDFYSPLDLREHYSKLTFAGAEKVGDQDTFALEAALPEGGPPDKLYFSARTGLPVRLVSEHHSPGGVSEFQEDFSDYREVDGVTLPFMIAQAGGESSFVVKISEVRHNLELEDGEFSKPAVQ
jgi:zinc protease